MLFLFGKLNHVADVGIAIVDFSLILNQSFYLGSYRHPILTT